MPGDTSRFGTGTTWAFDESSPGTGARLPVRAGERFTPWKRHPTFFLESQAPVSLAQAKRRWRAANKVVKKGGLNSYGRNTDFANLCFIGSSE